MFDKIPITMFSPYYWVSNGTYAWFKLGNGTLNGLNGFGMVWLNKTYFWGTWESPK